MGHDRNVLTYPKWQCHKIQYLFHSSQEQREPSPPFFYPSLIQFIQSRHTKNLSNEKGKRRSTKFLHPTTRVEAGKHKNKITQSRGKIDDLWWGKVRSYPGALSTIPCRRLLQPSVPMAIDLPFTSVTPEPSRLPLPFACIQPMSSQENICPQFGTHCPVSL